MIHDAVPQKLGARFIWQLARPYRARLAVGLALLVVGTACMMALPQVLRHMFDGALLTGDKAALGRTALVLLGLTCVLVAGVLARSQFIQLTATRVACDVRQLLADHLLTLDVAWFEREASGALLSRLTNDVVALRDVVQLGIPMLLRGVLVTVGTLVAMLFTSPVLAGVLLVAAVPAVALSALLGRTVRTQARAQNERLAAFSAQLNEQLGHPALWRAFGQEGRASRTLAGLLASIVAASRWQLLTTSAMVAGNVLVGFAGLTAVIWLGGLLVIDGTLTLGAMLAFVLYLGFLADGASNLTGFWPLWQSTLAALDRLNEVLAARPTVVSPPVPQALPAGVPGFRFEQVVYSYPSRPEAAALQGLNLDVPAGKTTALVGPSGVGKSTVLRLLLRLADPTAGQVQQAGVAVQAFDVAAYRRQFAWVAQETPILDATVADNLTFGAPDADESAQWQALEAACAADFVRALPQGLATPVGERGVQLSGGQRQRLALARALLTRAPVLVLDEATSHLDTETEARVLANLKTAAAGRTLVLVAHRLSTVQGADVIAVLDNPAGPRQAGGTRVVATGTHAGLLKTCPLYAALALVGRG